MEQREPSKLEYESEKVGRLLTDIEKLNEKFQSVKYYNAPLEEKTVAIAELKKAHEKILSAFGLTIVPAHFVETEKEVITPSKVEVIIDDLNPFFDKLKNLSQENLTPGLATLLKEVASGLRYEITRAGNLPKEKFPPEFLAKMTVLLDFTNEYHMIDPKNKWRFNESLKPLEKYSAAYEKGYLRELLYVENYDLGGTLEDWETKSGPLKWHFNTTIEAYRGHWLRAVKILEEIKENPNAEEFRNNLINQLLFAINRLKLSIPGDLKPTEKDAYLAILLEAKKKLEDML